VWCFAVRCEAAEAKAKVNRPDETDLANELSALHSTHEQLKGEFETYQDLANRTIESKDREISRLLSDNAALQKSSHVQSQVLKTCTPLFLVALCMQDVHLKTSWIHGSPTCLLQRICMKLTIALG
jgi:hypothetical protein